MKENRDSRLLVKEKKKGKKERKGFISPGGKWGAREGMEPSCATWGRPEKKKKEKVDLKRRTAVLQVFEAIRTKRKKRETQLFCPEEKEENRLV